MDKFDLISPHHKNLYQQYYEKHTIPVKANRWQTDVEIFARLTDSKHILDYGSGPARTLEHGLRDSGLTVTSYDPGVDGIDGLPEKADFVVSLDVIEHVEPSRVDEVISHIESLADKVIMLAISTQESTKLLPDGSPWHCFVRSYEYWQERLSDYSPLTVEGDRQEFVAYRIKK